MDYKRGLLIFAFAILFLGLVSADSPYSNCSLYGSCQPSVLKSTGGNTTNIYNQTFINQTATNFSILVDWANLTSIPSYVKDWNLSGLIQNWNRTNLIIDWNMSGLIKDWTYLGTNSSYYLNSNPLNFINTSNSIFSYFSNSTFYPYSSNPLGFYNSTTLPASSGITNGSSAWLNNLSLSGDFLVDGSTLFANATNNFIGINTSNPQNTLNIIGTFNITSTLPFNPNKNTSPLLVLGNGNGPNILLNSSSQPQLDLWNQGAPSNLQRAGLYVDSSGALDLFISNSGDSFESKVLYAERKYGLVSNSSMGYLTSETPNFRLVNLTAGNTVFEIGIINTTGTKSWSFDNAFLSNYTHLNPILTYVQTGNLINLTSRGATGLPPFTGTSVAVCSNSTNPAFAGVMMKNSSGVYGCPVAGGNWLKLF